MFEADHLRSEFAELEASSPTRGARRPVRARRIGRRYAELLP